MQTNNIDCRMQMNVINYEEVAFHYILLQAFRKRQKRRKKKAAHLTIRAMMVFYPRLFLRHISSDPCLGLSYVSLQWRFMGGVWPFI